MITFTDIHGTQVFTQERVTVTVTKGQRVRIGTPGASWQVTDEEANRLLGDLSLSEVLRGAIPAKPA